LPLFFSSSPKPYRTSTPIPIPPPTACGAPLPRSLKEVPAHGSFLSKVHSLREEGKDKATGYLWFNLHIERQPARQRRDCATTSTPPPQDCCHSSAGLQ
jgi:hypothetical protein